MRLAPFTGVYGISFVFAMMATALAVAVLRRPRIQLAWLAVLPALMLLPKMPEPSKGSETAVLLQSNISETAEWTTESVDRMHRDLVALTVRGAVASKDRPPILAVWPEVPAPLYYYDNERLRDYLAGLARALQAHLLVGVVAHTEAGEPLNSALLIAPTGVPVSRYDKINLVPFGEFVPWPFGMFAKAISNESGDFVSGSRMVVSPLDGHSIATFICYESVFPNFVRKFVANGADLLINISNDGWFGKSAARLQHLSIVRMRAAENRRWILRSTNDGITTAVDPAGRLRGTLPSYIEATSTVDFDFIRERTIYTRFGDWFPLLCATIAAMTLIAERVL